MEIRVRIIIKDEALDNADEASAMAEIIQKRTVELTRHLGIPTGMFEVKVEEHY